MTVFLLQSENHTRWGNPQFLVFHLLNHLHPPFTLLFLPRWKRQPSFHGSVICPPVWYWYASPLLPRGFARVFGLSSSGCMWWRTSHVKETLPEPDVPLQPPLFFFLSNKLLESCLPFLSLSPPSSTPESFATWLLLPAICWWFSWQGDHRSPTC